MTNLQKQDLEKIFSPTKVYFAIFIGLGATFYLFYTQNQGKNFYSIFNELSQASLFWIILSFFVLLIRDLGYMFRIKHLTNQELTWKGSIYTILLWEFASAITPSVVGGTTVAVFILSKEGIKFGKALAYVMLTAILDNAFFILATPIVLISSTDIFPKDTSILFGLPLSIESLFYISYTLILSYTFFMAYGLLLKPRAFKWILLKITRLPFLKKWHKNALEYGEQVILASKELKNKPFSYWLKAILSTVFVWSARYFLLNCLFAAYQELSREQHLDIFSKQIILWVTQLISPTPGGSGFAIYFLTKLFGGGTIVIGIGMIWRFMTYFTYLLLGSIFLPRWIKRVFFFKKIITP